MPEPAAPRDPVRTRQALIDAAARAVTMQGASVSLDAIARAAGVSKGGLLHHFPSKNELLISLADAFLEQFAAEVQSEMDADDQAPGRLIRAYIRASFRSAGQPAESGREQVVLLAALGAIPQIEQRLRDAADAWAKRLSDDGLHAERVKLIVRAADGASLASLFEGQTCAEEMASTRDLLLSLSRAVGPVLPEQA